MRPPATSTRQVLDGQLGIAWRLLELHLTGLTDAECLWRPAPRGLHVVAQDGEWRAQWPDSESYDAGPPSIAWLTWHIGFWWSSVLSHSFGDGSVRREEILWPGTAVATTRWLATVHDAWVGALSRLPDEAFDDPGRTLWPFTGKPFSQLAAWLNLELMKNASEIGYCRFLYAVRT